MRSGTIPFLFVCLILWGKVSQWPSLYLWHNFFAPFLQTIKGKMRKCIKKITQKGKDPIFAVAAFLSNSDISMHRPSFQKIIKWPRPSINLPLPFPVILILQCVIILTKLHYLNTGFITLSDICNV